MSMSWPWVQLWMSAFDADEVKFSACISWNFRLIWSPQHQCYGNLVVRQVIRHPARLESQEAGNLSLYGALWLYVGQVRSDIQKAVLASLPTLTSFSLVFRQSWCATGFFLCSCEFDEFVHLLSGLWWWVFLTGIPRRSGVTPVAFCSAQARRKRRAHAVNICQYVLVCLWFFGWKVEDGWRFMRVSCQMLADVTGMLDERKFLRTCPQNCWYCFTTWGMPIHSMVPKFEKSLFYPVLTRVWPKTLHCACL